MPFIAPGNHRKEHSCATWITVSVGFSQSQAYELTLSNLKRVSLYYSILDIDDFENESISKHFGS